MPTRCFNPTHHLDGNGLRVTSQAPPEGPPVLVAGSSFALGEEVRDSESWPAYLQQAIGRRVLNAGVSGYSLDQSVLRVEKLVPRFAPLMIVVSFTPDDVRRTELSMAWSRDKPWFAIHDGQLELHGVPVPPPGAEMPLPAVARLLGWSRLADVIARRTRTSVGWYFEERYGASPGSGPAISCLLMKRLAVLHVPVVVMAEYPRSHWLADSGGRALDLAATGGVLDCAAKEGLIAFDTEGPYLGVVADRGTGPLFRTEHHSAEGNRATADVLERELAERGLLPRSADR